MKHAVVLLSILLAAAIFMHTAAAADKSLPAELLAMDPNTECPVEGEARGWDVKASLYETEDADYLALFFDPGFSVQYEPWFELKAGTAVFVEKKGNVYFYRLGNLPKGKKIGRMSFNTLTPDRYERKPELGKKITMQKIVTMDLERRADTTCLRLIERKSQPVLP